MISRLLSSCWGLLAAASLLVIPAAFAAEDQESAPDGAPSTALIRALDAAAAPPESPAELQPSGPAPDGLQSLKLLEPPAPAAVEPDTPTPATPAMPNLPQVAPRLSLKGQTPIPAALQAEAARPAPVEPKPAAPAEPDPNPTLQVVEEKPPAKTPDEEPSPKLEAIPDAAVTGKVDIQTASFKGITPGETTHAAVQESWGSPKQIASQNGQTVYLYAVDPFDRVEVTLTGDKVGSIIIRLQQPVAAKVLAEQLQLAQIRPVLVSNEMGEILGQSYPERGVLFAFRAADEPSKATMQVADVILEPVGAEAFVLRAETYLDAHPADSAEDLKTAIKLQPELARAHWLQARVAASAGDIETALASSRQAVALEPANPQFLVTRAQILGQAGKFSDAIREGEAAIANAESRPHVKARALCLLGDLISSEVEPDYGKALKNHMAAISEADPLVDSPHPAIRLAAMEVIVDAHLGAAHDIAWGEWENKKVAVDTWLNRASSFAEGMVESGSAGPPLQFRVATRALASCVGARGQMDPTSWAQKAVEAGQKMIQAAQDPSQKNGIAWDLGLALYDAVQIYQMRDEQDLALQTGQSAIELLERGKAATLPSTDAHLLARLYFRLGTIYAVNKADHKDAVVWFDKAVPLFQQATDTVAPHEVARLGETLVSMGVSYWEVGNRDRGLELTETGVKLIEAAVEGQFVQNSVLEVPYSNLATMHRQLGQTDKAEEYFRMASERQTPMR
ncbi:MAG: tetratricopeptide repeat protein [Thermoguttaceae bacterium]